MSNDTALGGPGSGPIVPWFSRVAIGLSIATSVATVAGRFGQFAWPLELMSHFVVQLLAFQVIGLALLLICRRQRIAALFLPFALVNALVVAPYAFVPTWRAEAAPGPTRLVVLSANIHYERRMDQPAGARDRPPIVSVVMPAYNADDRPPIVSVVMPAYNAARYLPEAIESVLRQTFKDLELLIVDDGSVDDTLAVARRFAARDTRVKTITTANGGPAAARNAALEVARGDFIALLDSDDVIDPQYLAKQLGVLEANPDASIVTANAMNRGGGANFNGKPYWPQTAGVQRLTIADVIGQEDAVCILSVFRRHVYDRIGGFSRAFSGNEDYEFWVRASLAGFVIVRNFEPLGLYRRHQGSLSSNEPRMIRGVLNVLRHTRGFLGERSPEREVLDRQITRFTRELPRAEFRASLQRSDAAAASAALQTIAAERGGWMLGACARLTSCWPQPLLWVYRLRRGVRERSASPARSAA